MNTEKQWPLLPHFLVGPVIWECVAYAIMLVAIAIPGSFASQGAVPTPAVFLGFLLLIVGAFICFMAYTATGHSAVAQVLERMEINRGIRKRNKS